MSKDIPTIGYANQERQSRDTPEHRLWITVLRSFLDEAKTARGTDKAPAYLAMAKGEWYQFICDLIDIDHSVLVRYVKEILGPVRE